MNPQTMQILGLRDKHSEKLTEQAKFKFSAFEQLDPPRRPNKTGTIPNNVSTNPQLCTR